MDWAVANGGSNTIWIYLGNGDGTSKLPTIIPLRGQAPIALAAADMNRDGIIDLVVAEADSEMIAVLLGNGDGTFAPEYQFAAPSIPISLAVADLDGDGNPDVVAGVLSTPVTGRLAFFHGDGNGKLSYPVFRDNVIEPLYFNPISLSVADLDGDGHPDIVVLDLGTYGLNGESLESQDYSAGARVYLNQGNGVFKLYQQFFFDQTADQTSGELGVAATAIALGDVDKDGCTDAIVLDTTGTATFFPGLCDGSFDTSNTRIFGSGIVAGAAALTDLNHDGNLDLVSSGTSFADFPPYQTSDGNSISVQFGDGIGNFGLPALYRGEPEMFSLAVVDLNGDGRGDVITANQGSDTVSVYLNSGQGNFGGPTGAYLGYLTGNQQKAVTNAASQFIASVDVNGDGHKDLITIEAGAQSELPAQLTALLGDGTGNFGTPIRSPLFEAYDCNGLCLDISDFALEDFRNLGRPDLLLLGYMGGANPVLSLVFSANNGDGTFQKPTITSLNNISTNMFVTGDFNGDGKLDLIFLTGSFGPAGQPVSIDLMVGNGSGAFAQGPQISFGSSGSSAQPSLITAQAADMNHDGKLDLLVIGNGLLSPTDQNALYEFLGNGDGTFQPPKLLFNNFSQYFALADLNHDGLPDIVEAVRGILNSDPLTYPWQYQIYLAQTDGTFLSSGSYGPYDIPEAFGFFTGTPDKPLRPPQPLLADFTGDGNIDIAVYESGLQAVPTYFGSTGASTGSDIRILIGNGDGTFTPSSFSYGFGRYVVPELAVDVNGDNRADLLEINGYTSSYDVILASPGPTFQPALVAVPVVGANGLLRIVLAAPASSATVFQVTATDPSISIPSTITIPAGSTSVDTTFQIASSFNENKAFAFTVTLGAETHTAYGTQAAPSRAVGFQAFLAGIPPVILPTQSTGDYQVNVGSIGGYSTTLQFSCQGLPAGASCQFGAGSLGLGDNEQIQTSLVVNTHSNFAIGTYPFKVVITDGLITQDIQASLGVGDFTMSIAPASSSPW